MKCANHLDRDATGICNRCGKSICGECQVSSGGETYCLNCFNPKTGQVKKEERSPALASALSFIIAGLGQVYNGQVGKGLLIFFTSWLVIPWIIGIFDAYSTAKKINEGKIVCQAKPGCLIAFIIGVIVFFMSFFVLALLAAIAVPNLLRARLHANEAYAKRAVQDVSSAIETFRAANNGDFPDDETDLTKTSPPYLDKSYNNREIAGYEFKVEIGPRGYKVIAMPKDCGMTGTKIFVIGNDMALTEETCRRRTE